MSALKSQINESISKKKKCIQQDKENLNRPITQEETNKIGKVTLLKNIKWFYR